MRGRLNTIQLVAFGMLAKVLRGLAFLFAGAVFFNEDIGHKFALAAVAVVLMLVYFVVCCRFLGKAE